MIQLSCPVCLRHIETDRILGNKAYCSCGHICYVSTSAARAEKSKGSLSIVLFAAILLATAIHIVNWDTYFFSIIPLKVKQLAGVASVNELKQIAQICQKRKKPNCEIQALNQAYARGGASELRLLLRVGQIHMEAKDYKSASQTYKLYFEHGGIDLDARYNFAVALGGIGSIEAAKKQFQHVLGTKSRIPKFHVARSYVDLLIKNKDLVTAKYVIEQYRRASANSGLFLEKELKFINAQISKGSYYKTASKNF